MIRNFRSKPLRRLWEKADPSGIRPDWISRVGIILDALNRGSTPAALDLPGFGFHALKGDRTGRYAVTVSRNWRITFGWQDGDATDIDLEDYHGR